MSLHREVDARLARDGKNVQHRVGRAAHRDVQRHRVLEGLEGRDAARQDRGVALEVVTSRQLDDAAAPRPRTAPSACAWVASSVPLPGRASPSASFRQFMLFAVNMPEHEPQVGHAERSIRPSSSSLTFVVAAAIIESIRSSLRVRGLPSRSWVPVSLPASIGPPETKMVGMLSRIAAISMPGVILSQLEMHTSASAQWALTMYSTLSAMRSRLGSE